MSGATRIRVGVLRRRSLKRTALSSLAVAALLAVAVVLANGGGNAQRHASAAAGTVFVANEWSKQTNESPAPTGYLFGTPVYATYATASRLVETLSNRIKIVVVDADLNFVTQVYDNTAQNNFGFSQISLDNPGDSTILVLSSEFAPIAGPASSIKVRNGSCTDQTTCNVLVDLVASGQVSVVVGFTGDGGIIPGWITVTSNIGTGSATQDVTIEYPTSGINNTDTSNTYVPGAVRVTSDVGGAQAFVHLVETGRSTGRFAGYFELVPLTGFDSNSSAPGDALAAIRVVKGPITVNYNDANVTRATQVLIDRTAPTVLNISPATGAATQNRLPTFPSSINETESGLKLVQQVVSAVNTGPANCLRLVIDRNDDPLNAVAVLDINGILGNGNFSEPVSMGVVADGQLNFAFSHTPSTIIPNIGANIPDHIVDWQVRVTDLAGNIRFSDSDPTSPNAPPNQGNAVVVAGGFSAHVVRIDQKVPGFRSGATTPNIQLGDHRTGLSLDVSNAETIDKSAVRVRFTDSVTNVEPSDFSVNLDTGGLTVPVSVQVKAEKVYLKFASPIAPNDTPIVSLAGSISDLAGNSSSVGSTGISDGTKPVLIASTSGGSGTGTGAEGPDQLTKNLMTIHVASDEPLSGVPEVEVYVLAGAQDGSDLLMLADGPMSWNATYNGSPFSAGEKAVVVRGFDTAASGSPAAPASNVTTVGASTVKSFRLDKALVIPVVAPTGAIFNPRPTISLTFVDEQSSVSISEITLDGLNVTALLVPTFNNKVLSFVPASDLALGLHVVAVPAIRAFDAAGNTNFVAIVFNFTMVPAPAMCNGVPVTLLGTAGDDVITGSPLRDVIAGLGGNDTIDGKEGNDLICGNDGDDVIAGGIGNDKVFGNAGDDLISGGAGNDVLTGNDGADVLQGGVGTDTLKGSGGDDSLVGGTGDDAMDCGSGSDFGNGGTGVNTFTACELTLP